MEPDILPRNHPEDVISRKVEDYHFDNEVSKRRFEESIPLKEALPVIVRRIVRELNEKGKVLIWVTGAWRVGKTTFGKSLLEGLTGIPTVYLDGDSDEGYKLIQEVVENGPAEGQIVLIAAPYIEKRSFKKIPQPPIIINLIADETTRHNNLYNRAGGQRSLSLSVERIIRYRRESPNYIIPDPDAIIVDSSLQCRIPPELISQQVKDLLAIERKKRKQPESD